VRLVFCFAGKTHRGPVREILDDYLARLRKYARIEVIEAKILKVQNRPGVHVALDPGGDAMGSERFAAVVGRALELPAGTVFFYTGGADGLPREVVEDASMRLSLSPMTFNHQIVRAMLLEQVYRAMTILRKEPYHRP